jgi:hypothetical protein
MKTVRNGNTVYLEKLDGQSSSEIFPHDCLI